MSTYILQISKKLLKVNNKEVFIDAPLDEAMLTPEEIKACKDFIQKRRKGMKLQSGIT